jgi:hypothetical protein
MKKTQTWHRFMRLPVLVYFLSIKLPAKDPDQDTVALRLRVRQDMAAAEEQEVTAGNTFLRLAPLSDQLRQHLQCTSNQSSNDSKRVSTILLPQE